MTSVTRSHQILIHAPLRSVFDYLADLTRHPEWSDGELKIEALAPGPVAVGKEYISRGEVAIQTERSPQHSPYHRTRISAQVWIRGE